MDTINSKSSMWVWSTAVCVDLAMAKQKALESNLICAHLNQKLCLLWLVYTATSVKACGSALGLTATFTTLATAFKPEARTTSLLIKAMATLLTRLG